MIYAGQRAAIDWVDFPNGQLSGVGIQEGDILEEDKGVEKRKHRCVQRHRLKLPSFL